MSNQVDTQYLTILQKLLSTGELREGRNGRTFSLFGEQMRFNLAEGFPLLTTKKVHFKSIVVELLWFLRGDTNVAWLHEHGVTIWDEWADTDGDLGPVYGKQWRNWQVIEEVDPNGWPSYRHDHVDQIANLIDGLKRDPYGRRHIVSAWNPADVDQMALPPCHCLFQFYVDARGLSCHLYQRSADWFLGVPFNIASYALLTHLVAREVGLGVGDLVMSFGDLHLYENHLAQAGLQLAREARDLPVVVVDSEIGYTILSGKLRPEHISVHGYNPHPAIRAEVSA